MKRRDFLASVSMASFALPVQTAWSASEAAASSSSYASPSESPAPDEVTRHVAEFVVGTRWQDLPPGLIEAGKKSLLDALGLAVAGRRADSGAIVMRYLASLGLTAAKPSIPSASILGTGVRVPPRFAAFANGIAIHADDFDDTQLAVNPTRVYGLLTHPSVTAMPSALAMSQSGKRSGKEFMLAYHLGVEVETKIAEAIAPRHYEDGFHTTGTCGVFGSAVASAQLRGFRAEQVQQTLGLAAAQSGGLRENFGTMTKPFQAGHAAEAGVIAADLIALGWTAASNILEAKRGFFQAEGGGYDASVMTHLGRPWSFLTPGISIKPFPSGSLSHPGMTLLQGLIAKNKIKPGDVAQVRVGASKQMLNTMIHHDPKTGLEAKFSIEFCMAILLINGGHASLGDFQDKVVRRPDVQAMVHRVDFYDNPAADAAGLDKMRTIIDIRLNDGRTISGQADYGKGSPQDPMTYDDVAEKFRGCAAYAGIGAARAGQVIDMVRHLEDLPDITRLTGLLGR
jgi:2-methylcitrate dehydratase PrpD